MARQLGGKGTGPYPPGPCDYEIDHRRYQHVSSWNKELDKIVSTKEDHRECIIVTPVEWDEPILSENIEHVQELQDDQDYLLQKILKPNYKSKADLEREARPGFRGHHYGDSDEDSW